MITLGGRGDKGIEVGCVGSEAGRGCGDEREVERAGLPCLFGGIS